MISPFFHEVNVDKIPSDFPWAQAFKASKLCVVVENERRIVGACGIRGPFNVLSIYVLEEYQGKGVGNSLLQSMITAAKEKGYRCIILSVGWGLSENVPARSLFRKHGFRRVVEIGNQCVMMSPITSVVGNVLWHLVCVFFSLCPRCLRGKVVELASRL